MKTSVLPNSLMFEGALDEETSQSELLAAYSQLTDSGSTGPICLDFSKVPYGNSAGIIIWIRYMAQTKAPFEYINTPIWLIGQLNMIKDFLSHGSTVSSFQAPYFSNQTQESKSFTLEVGKDIPILADYQGFKVPNRIVDGKEFEADFDPERYLAFISENFAQFQRFLK